MKYFVTVLVIGFIALMLWTMWVIYSRITANKLLREGRNKKSFAFCYLSTRFSRLNTLKDVKLVVRDRSLPDGKFLADMGLVFVNRGGIFIVDSIYGSGNVEVEDGGQWCRTINDKQYFFDDPIVLNDQKVRIMKMFLRDMHFENIPVHGIVLFTGKRVRISKRIYGLVTAPELAPFLADANKDLILRGSEIRKVVNLIKSKQA